MKWELVNRRILYKGFFSLLKLRVRYALFEGGMSVPVDREVMIRGHAVGVLLFDPDADVVVMIEQFRIGAINSDRSPWLKEVVAGLIDEGETAEEVAIRESIEETGCQPERLHKIAFYLSSPGGTDESVTLFVGKVDSTSCAGIHGLIEEGENIKVHLLPAEEAFAQVESGLIDNAMAIIALQWLQLHKQSLLSLWG